MHRIEPPKGVHLHVMANTRKLSSFLIQMRILMIRVKVAVMQRYTIFVVILQLSLIIAFRLAAKVHCLQAITQSALQILIFRPINLTKITAIGVFQLMLD